MMVSARDQIPARVTNVNEGAAIADVELRASIFPGIRFRAVSSAQPMEPFTNRDWKRWRCRVSCRSLRCV